MLAGILRPFAVDDQRGNVGPLSTSQFIGLASVAAGLALLVYLVRRYRRDPQSLRLWQQPAVAGDAGGQLGTSTQSSTARGGGKRRKRR